MDNVIDSYISRLRELLTSLPRDDIQQTVELLHRARLENKQVFIMGNGGSASTASHFACDLGKNTIIPGHPRFRVLALTDNFALFSAYANDNGYASVFEQQLASMVNPQDVVIGISTSGNSPNVLNAIAFANHAGATTVGFTGFDGGRLGELVDAEIRVPSNCIEQVEDVHLMLEHLIVTALRERMRRYSETETIQNLKSQIPNPKSQIRNSQFAIPTVLVTGGAGYVGAVLVPKLLDKGYRVKVLDLYIYGEHVLDAVKDHPNLDQIKGDIRDRPLLERVVPGCDAVIHLACISNDPSFELDPALGRSINYDAFLDLVEVSKKSGVHRFIYASSSSVYGVKEEENVTEDLPLEPLTDYSKYKALCEEVLLREREPGFVTLILRPATVCGYSPRLRLDLTVNILTNHAVNNKKITVFGGQQKRPNIHIEDMTDLYVKCLEWPDEAIDGRVFNAGYENYRIIEIAEMVRGVVGKDVEIATTPTDDHRSYHISSEKIRRELDFVPQHTVEDAVHDLVAAFHAGKIPNPMTDIRYYNIKTMQHLQLK